MPSEHAFEAASRIAIAQTIRSGSLVTVEVMAQIIDEVMETTPPGEPTDSDARKAAQNASG